MRHRFLAPVALLVALATTLTACSSSGGGGGASASAGGSSSGAASAPATSGGSGGGGTAAAKAATVKNLQAPTTVPLTEPLKTKPPTGKTFVWMKCDVNQCTDEGVGLKAAAQAIGWNYKELSYKSADPASLVSAMKQALQYKPVAVGLSGLPRAVWQSIIPAYKAANVKIVTGYIGPMQYDDTVIGQVGGSSDVAQYGQIIANWTISDSNGKANILLQNVNDFPVLKVYSDAFTATIKARCPGCKITNVDNTIPQVSGGQVVSTVVAALQKDKSINYVVTCNGPFLTGLPAALASAGLSNVKIAGESGDVQNLTNVKLGKENAYTGLALHYGAWLMIDMVLRNMQGISFKPDGDGGLPKQLLTKNVEFTVSNSYDKPADYADQLKKLWKVG